MGLILAAPAMAMIVLHVATGFGLRDLRALGKCLFYRRAAIVSIWRAPASEGELADFILPGGNAALTLRSGGLCALVDGTLRPLGPPEGVLRLFPTAVGGAIWAAGSYHRVLSWDAAQGLDHLLSLGGAVREVQGTPERLVVGFEGETLESGFVKCFCRRSQGVFEPEGAEIPVGMDRWSAFDLSPDGLLVVANLRGGKGVGVWSIQEGRLLASWPLERLARILCFMSDGRVLFDRGPLVKGLDAVYANRQNQLLVATVGAATDPIVVVDDFAVVLSSTRWPDRRRMAFSDMEGLVRVVDLAAEPRLMDIFAPRGRGIPWKLRPDGEGVWLLSKNEDIRLERFNVKGCRSR